MEANCNITPNAEIAGIGIRVSIYAQAFLAFVLATLALFRFAIERDITVVNPEAQDLRDIDPTRDEIEFLLKSDIPLRQVMKRLQRRYLRDEDEEERDVRQTRLSVQLTGVALLTSAVIQAKLYELDVYHALLVLNLCWINNITAVTLYLTDMFIHNPRKHFLRRPYPSRFWTADGLKNARAFLPTSAYLAALGGFGLWLFVDISYFGGENAEECNPLVNYWIYGHNISVTAQGFRITAIVVHAIACTPILNLLVESWLLCRGANSVQFVLFYPYRMYKKATGHDIDVEQHLIAPQYRNIHFLHTLLALAGVYIFYMVSFIVDSEMMIYSNSPSMFEGDEDEESQWTFGQTLVMVLLVPVIWDIWEKSANLYRLWKDKKEEDGAIERAVLRLREEKGRQEKQAAFSENVASVDGGRDDDPDNWRVRQPTRAQTMV